MPGTAKTLKLIYIERLRVVLTVLVILHHAFITYGAPGSWYFAQKTEMEAAKMLLTLFVAVNQSFFMGFFFFLSALFIPSSYDKKGPAKFMADRLVRLGIPLLFYSFILSPFLSYMPYRFAEGHQVSYIDYLKGFDGWINFGVLWFVLALLLFTTVYVIIRKWISPGTLAKVRSMPSAGLILGTATAVGFISYLVRINFPVGWVLQPLGFQLGHFPQYIAMFILGLVASRQRWLETDAYRTGKVMARVAVGLVVLGFPAFVIARNILGYPVSDYNVGGHWPSLWYAVWEQLLGFSICAALICIGKVRWNNPSSWVSQLSRTTFAVYIFHPLVLIALSVAVSGWPVEPLIKLAIVAPLSVMMSFALGAVLVRIPGINKVV
ncbi:acyltransferase family protein [Mucilaginibacter auburnensis]|uniref:Acyltransferase-like protein n=1 Tax=Mucilaginibacter auburnensis TaxID=1457233 RepID=A0A2H9VMD0_9SPHI|nr:acyltransferase [Mucilaginibacter auburnensis]PJJ79482.1 acyltransferase-like protein [Mucilaginibacter auburnensis]